MEIAVYNKQVALDSNNGPSGSIVGLGGCCFDTIEAEGEHDTPEINNGHGLNLLGFLKTIGIGATPRLFDFAILPRSRIFIPQLFSERHQN